MRDLFGVLAWRQKPLRERLLPWPYYAILSVVGTACGLYLLSEPDGLRNNFPVAVLFFVMVPALVYMTVLSRRLRR